MTSHTRSGVAIGTLTMPAVAGCATWVIGGVLSSILLRVERFSISIHQTIVSLAGLSKDESHGQTTLSPEIREIRGLPRAIGPGPK